jgi:hypothetical protein
MDRIGQATRIESQNWGPSLDRQPLEGKSNHSGPRPQVRTKSPKKFNLPRSGHLPAWATVTGSIFAILILLTSSTNPGIPQGKNRTSSDLVPLNPYSNLSASYYPYLENASTYPTPDALTNESGALSLPKVATTAVGGDQYYLVVFILTDANNDSILAFQAGTYNASMAQTILENSGGRGATCLEWCAEGNNLPIQWDAPTLIASFGAQKVQADSIATYSSYVAVAASVDNVSELYLSGSLGSAGSWASLTGNKPLAGTNPELDLARCDVWMTTLSPKNLNATVFSFATPVCNPGLTPGVQGFGDEGEEGGFNPPGAAPGVSGVIPFQDNTVGASILLNGTNLGTVTQVDFGPFPSTSFTPYPEPGGDMGLLAQLPAGSGLVNVQVFGSGQWSATNCSNEFDYLAALPSGTPQVYNVTPNASALGQTVTILGDNFRSGDTVWFGSIELQSSDWTLVSGNEIQATVPAGWGTGVVVSVDYQGIPSPETCPTFNFEGPFLGGVSPNEGYAGETVDILGENFSTGAEVYFGSSEVSTTYVSPTELTVAAPSGSGTEQVTVEQSGFTSNSEGFTYQVGATLTSITPAENYQTLWLSEVLGTNFSTSSVVYFGSTEALQTSYISPTELSAQIPDGSGDVSVTVHEAGTVSNGVEFQYLNPDTTVSSVYPSVAPAGTTVVLAGTGFTDYTQVNFGSVASSSVTYVSSTELRAVVPNGSGTVAVITSQFGASSMPSCYDYFLYGPLPAAGTPLVNCLSPTSGAPYGLTGVVILYGQNLSSDPFVFFGGVAARWIGIISSTELEAEPPLGYGSVAVTVSDAVGTSPVSTEDYFQITDSPPSSPLCNSTAGSSPHANCTTWNLYPALSAQPLDNGLVVATNESNSTVTVYSNFGVWQGVYLNTSESLSEYNTTLGSSIFDEIGDSSLFVENGTPGQVAAVSNANASEIFIVYTTDSGGVTVAETLSSHSGGRSWSGPYLASASDGTVTDPGIAMAPSGDIYVTWRENRGGPWEVDQTVYGPSGRLIQSPEPIPGSGGSTGLDAASPSVAVDALDRPFYAWGASNSTNASSWIEYTGAFVSPATVLTSLWNGFANTSGPDFFAWGGHTVGTAVTQVDNDWNRTAADLSSFEEDHLDTSLAAVQSDALFGLYATISTYHPAPVLWGPPAGGSNFQSQWSGFVESSLMLNASGTEPIAPDVYLWVEMEVLLESLGVGTMPSPSFVWSLDTGVTGSSGPGLYPLGKGDTVGDLFGDVLSVRPITLNPASVYLNVTGSFTSRTVEEKYYNSHDQFCGYGNVTDTPSKYWTNVSAVDANSPNGEQSGSYSSWSAPPSVYLTMLNPDEVGNWWATITATYVANETIPAGCPGATGHTLFGGSDASIPSKLAVSTDGTFVTGLSPYPWGLNLSAVSSGTSGTDYLNWTNTMEAQADIWVNTSVGATVANWSDPQWELTEHGVVGPVPESSTQVYTLTMMLRSAAMQASPSWEPTLPVDAYASPDYANVWAACTFTQEPQPNIMYWDPTIAVSNVTATSATITWFDSQSGAGWVTFNDTFGNGYNVSAQTFGPLGSGSPYPAYQGDYEYIAELHDLEPWGIYSLVAHVEITQACQPVGGPDDLPVNIAIEYSNSTGPHYFQTAAITPLTEHDLPYDSVTKEGGGAAIDWQVPTNFVDVSEFVNGTATFTNASGGVIQVPITSPSSAQASRPSWWGGTEVNTTYTVNVTGLQPNTTYNAGLELNYTLVKGPLAGHSLTALGENVTFTYQKDTSGDRLANAEKVLGWNVTRQGPLGSTSVEHVTANPNLYATNGLVSDYLEKEFGLNPATIDTAGSHMLDTWNLTFDLGSSSTCPAYFECWYETGWNPYQFDVTPTGPNPGGSPVATNITSVAHWGKGGLQDDAPYDAEVIWEGHALQVVQGLIQNERVGWLRGVIMEYGGDYTLTVWGKLSWGANPLAASTSYDGIPDGAQVDPLGTTDVQLDLTGWTETAPSAGDGVAAFIRANSSATRYAAAATDYSAYSLQITAGCRGSCGSEANFPNGTSPTSFVVTFPVTSTEQYAWLNLSLVENYGSNGNSKFYWFDTGECRVNLLAYGLEGSATCPTTGGSNWSVSFTYQALTVFSKAPTYVLVPGDNSTLTPLPLGLKRYSGEQNFVLLEVNDTVPGANSLTMGSIPYVNTSAVNGISTSTYSVALSGGMDNVLVPRASFMDSPLGQALVNKTTSNIGSDTIASTSYNGFLQPDWSPTSWFDRVNQTPGRISGLVNISANIVAWSNKNQNCTGDEPCGGVPSSPAAEAKVPSLAIQSIFVLNVTSASYASDDLSALLSGLLLNSSGNVSDWLFPATDYLPSLGLTATVMSALANSAVRNDGAFGAPVSSARQSNPRSWWGAVASDIWNAVSGVITALGDLVSVIWNAVAAAVSFMADLAAKAATWALSAANSVLNKVAAAMLWAIEALATAVLDAIRTVLDSLVGAVWSGITAVLDAIMPTEENAESLILSYLDSGGSESAAGSALLEGILPFVVASAAIAVGIEVAITASLPLTLGAGLILGLLATVILSFMGSDLESALSGGLHDPMLDELLDITAMSVATAVASVEYALNYTLSESLGTDLSSSTLQPVPDPINYVGALFYTGTFVSAGIGGILLFSNPNAAAIVGFIYSLTSLALATFVILFAASLPHSCNYLEPLSFDSLLGFDIFGFFLGALGLVGDVKGFGATATNLKWLATFGLVLDFVGLGGNIYDLGQEIGCEPTTLN